MPALLQTEFCNPVFEGEEPRAAPNAKHPPEEDGTSPALPRDGLGTHLGVCTHAPVYGASTSSHGSGIGVVGQATHRALGPSGGPTNIPRTRDRDMLSQGSAGRAGRWQGGGMASSTLALPAFLALLQVSSSGARQAGGTVLTASSPGSAWL